MNSRGLKGNTVRTTQKGPKPWLHSLRGMVLRIVVMSAKSHSAPPALPPYPNIAVSTVVLTPDSDAWGAYSIVSGIASEGLDGCEFLVDSNGWLRAVFKPSAQGEWANPDAFISGARKAEDNPIQDTDSGSMHMMH